MANTPPVRNLVLLSTTTSRVSDSNQRRFLIKIKDADADSRDTSRKSVMHEFAESGLGRASMKVENLVDSSYEPDFFVGLATEVKMKRSASMVDNQQSK